MAKSRRVIMRKTTTIAAIVTVALYVSYSIVCAITVSTDRDLCCYSSKNQTGAALAASCCAEGGSDSGCCYSGNPAQNENFLISHVFDRSIYFNNISELPTYIQNNFIFVELSDMVCEERFITPQDIVYLIFKPPKTQAV
ncbi:MAG: hypothetical protein LBH20_00175 [Treponema sp.]|nr:hypothetical protein [Treponema sp.]